MRYLDNGLTALKVAYVFNREVIADEVVDLT